MTDVINKADENADEGLQELKSAQNYQKKAGKCQCCLIWIILIALVTSGIIVYFKVIKPNQDSSDDNKDNNKSDHDGIDRDMLIEQEY